MTYRQKIMSDLEGLTFDDWHTYHCDTDVQGIAIDALELLKKAQWISVKDRLPDVEGNYLAWEISGFAFVDTFKDGEWVTGSANLAVITHWMPLPEPPEEVKQE